MGFDSSPWPRDPLPPWRGPPSALPRCLESFAGAVRSSAHPWPWASPIPNWWGWWWVVSLLKYG
jgi:hypothetical protein